MVLSLQPDSPLDTSSGLQEGLSLSSVWQVVDEEPSEVHGQVQQGLGQNLDGWKPAGSADTWQAQEGRGTKAHLSQDGDVAIVTEDVQNQVQDGGDCPSNNGPQQGEGQEGVSGEKREEDVPGVITFHPNESTHQDLQNLREPADHGQVPETDTQTDVPHHIHLVPSASPSSPSLPQPQHRHHHLLPGQHQHADPRPQDDGQAGQPITGHAPPARQPRQQEDDESGEDVDHVSDHQWGSELACQELSV